MKKALKGLIKTRHFLLRQRERKVSDEEILKAIRKGSVTEIDHGQHFVLGDLKVTVDFDHEILITVHPGDPKSKATRIMTREEAGRIKALIQEKRAEEVDSEKENEFEKHMKETAVKKISR